MALYRLFQRLVTLAVVIGIIISAGGSDIFAGDDPYAHTHIPQQNERRLIESDDSLVHQEGSWTTQSAAGASGGSYLYNAGSQDDVLTLEFSGTTLEVIYVAGPNLGTIAIEIDGTVLRTVITANDVTVYNQHAIVSYLADGFHTARIYSQRPVLPSSGIVAIDAFYANINQASISPSSVNTKGLGYSNLLAQLEKGGSVRVIVGFQADFDIQTENLGGMQARNQRSAIRHNRDNLIRYMGVEKPRILSRSDEWVVPYVAMEVDYEGLQRLISSPRVISIKEDVPGQLALGNVTTIIGAQTLWGMGYEGSGQTIALLDSGVWSNHPFLLDKVVAEACFSYAGTDDGVLYHSTCPNRSSSQVGVGAADPGISYGINWHGTYMAGVLVGSNGIPDAGDDTGDPPFDDFDGVAREADLIAINITSRVGDSDALEIFQSDLISGLQFVYNLDSDPSQNYNISAINLSMILGGSQTGHTTSCDDYYPGLKSIIDLLYSRDIAVMAASGNQGSNIGMGAPACISNVISVGATVSLINPIGPLVADEILADSNMSPNLDILAPANIYSSLWLLPADYYAAVPVGTSTAAAVATGAWTLLKEARPDATIEEILQALKLTGRQVAFVRDLSQQYSKPRINLSEAVGYLSECDPEDEAHIVSRATGVDGSLGEQANNHTNPEHISSISDDSRFVVFVSEATSLDSGPAGGVFLRDRHLCTTTRVSVSSSGVDSSGRNPQISGDGRFVVFQSSANNLVSGDTNNRTDIFVHDTVRHETSRVSIASDGTQGNQDSLYPTISADGRYIVFQSLANNLVGGDNDTRVDIFLYDRFSDETRIISVNFDGENPNGDSGTPLISRDGKFVAFSSAATNMIDGGTSSGRSHVYLIGLNNGTPRPYTITLLSEDGSGNEGNGDSFLSSRPSISDAIYVDADTIIRYIVFESDADNLVNSDTNNLRDVFVASYNEVATQGNSSLYHAPVRVNVSNLGSQTIRNTTTMVPGNSHYGSISADGRFVAFDSDASNLVTPDTHLCGSWPTIVPCRDVFWHDRDADADGIFDEIAGMQTIRISSAPNGDEAMAPSGTWQGLSMSSSISADGYRVVYNSHAPNLVTGDTGNFRDVIVTPIVRPPLKLVARSASSTEVNLEWISPSDNVTDYRIYRSIDGISFTELNPEDTSTSTSYHDITLSPSTTYYYRVAAYYGIIDISRPSNIVVVRTFPNAPSNLVATPSSQTAITLTWVDNSPDETGFRLERSPNGDTDWTEIAVPLSGTTTYADTTLICETTYYYRVRAYRDEDPVLVDQREDLRFTPYTTVAFATTQACPILAPSGLTATVMSSTQINLNWSDNSSNETAFEIERSPNGITNWQLIHTVTANQVNYSDNTVTCRTIYHYRVRATGTAYSAYSNTAWQITNACQDTLAMFDLGSTPNLSLVKTIDDNPLPDSYYTYAPGTVLNGQWLMGDWNGDGLETPGVYHGAAFFFTNDLGPTSNWTGIWFGLPGPAVSGRFTGAVNDCIGAIDWILVNNEPAFALYYTCDLTHGPTPPLSYQWLSQVLVGESGNHQFVTGDWNADNIDSVAVRRGNTIAYTNQAPTITVAQLSYAQYFGAPSTSDYGTFVGGDWDHNNIDSFGLFYTNGHFYYRNDLDWNSGIYGLQRLVPISSQVSATAWR